MIRLRQIAFAARDLEKAEHELTTVLGVNVVYRDPGVEQWGLHNILVPLSGDIIEVVAPFKPNTPVSRILDKRQTNACGYMIIMQGEDARARQQHIVSQKLGQVIFEHHTATSSCMQYHPRTVPGGVIPEWDSQAPTSEFSDPLHETFSPWHACGSNSSSYIKGMREAGDLRLKSVHVRLAPGHSNNQEAADRWREVFGVEGRHGNLQFTNAMVIFLPGQAGLPEGIEMVTVAVNARERFDGILQRARALDLCGDGWIAMCGVKWVFELAERSTDAVKL